MVGFDKRRAQIAITLFGNAKTVVLAAGGIFPDIHADPGHQLPRMGEAFDIADFSDHGQGEEVLDTLVAC